MRLKAWFGLKAKIIQPCTKFFSLFKSPFSSSTSSIRLSRHRHRHRHRLCRPKTVRFRKPFSFKPLHFPRYRRPTFRLRHHRRPRIPFPQRRPRKPNKPIPKVRIAELLTVLFSLRKTKETEEEEEEEEEEEGTIRTHSASEKEQIGNFGKDPFPSPITPAYVKKKEISSTHHDDGHDDDVHDDDVGMDACRSFEKYLMEMVVEERNVKDLKDVEELLFCWGNLKSPLFVDLVCSFYGELCMDLFASSQDEALTNASY